MFFKMLYDILFSAKFINVAAVPTLNVAGGVAGLL